MEKKNYKSLWSKSAWLGTNSRLNSRHKYVSRRQVFRYNLKKFFFGWQEPHHHHQPHRLEDFHCWTKASPLESYKERQVAILQTSADCNSHDVDSPPPSGTPTVATPGFFPPTERLSHLRTMWPAYCHFNFHNTYYIHVGDFRFLTYYRIPDFK